MIGGSFPLFNAAVGGHKPSWKMQSGELKEK